jgi:hypothetical protein
VTFFVYQKEKTTTKNWAVCHSNFDCHVFPPFSYSVNFSRMKATCTGSSQTSASDWIWHSDVLHVPWRSLLPKRDEDKENQQSKAFPQPYFIKLLFFRSDEAKTKDRQEEGYCILITDLVSIWGQKCNRTQVKMLKMVSRLLAC